MTDNVSIGVSQYKADLIYLSSMHFARFLADLVYIFGFLASDRTTLYTDLGLTLENLYDNYSNNNLLMCTFCGFK